MKIEWNRKSKLNNKGNTLAIVIIGIFILSILGTLILSLTATNYKMKLNDKKSEDTFYYAEKALDEVYAKIEADAMQCARDAYAEVMGTYIEDNGSTLNIRNSIWANREFKVKYKEKLEVNYRESSVNYTLNYLRSGITNVSGYRFALLKLDGAEATSVRYNLDADSLLTEIVLQNVCVECNTEKTGFYSSIITDFTIKVPDITMDLMEHPGGFNFDELFGYAVIAEGSTADFRVGSRNASIMIDNNNTTITGNVYAGNENNCDSVRVGDSALNGYQAKNLNIKASNFVCKGPFVLYGSNAKLRNLDGDDNSVDAVNSLQFYAKDIKLEKTVEDNPATINLDIVGNCIVSDDMEVNGDYYNVAMKGNYFGYGFQQGAARGVEADSNLLTVFDKSIYGTPLVKEHEQRSAIIINGKYADINMTGVRQMILGGRAYIDLDGGIQSGGDVSYMTGESVSFKGNQQIYLADSQDMDGALGGANPIMYQKFVDDGYYDEVTHIVNYSQAGLNPDKVVAKKINDEVYFYKKESNPTAQTNNFVAATRNANKLAAIKAHIRNDLHVRNLTFSNSLRAHTVGAMMSVENGNMGDVTIGDTINQDDFLELIDDINIRRSHLETTLHDVSTDSTILGQNPTAESLATSTITPYDYFMSTVIKPSFMNSREAAVLSSTEVNGYGEIKAALTAAGYSDADISAGTVRVGYIISNDSTTTIENVGFDAGIIITNRDVSISKNFTGIVVTDGTVRIHTGSNISLNACKDLVVAMFKEIPELGVIINSNMATEPGDDLAIGGNGLEHKQLVEKSNWRRNVN